MKKVIIIFVITSFMHSLQSMERTAIPQRKELSLSAQILLNGIHSSNKREYDKALSLLASAYKLSSDPKIKHKALYALGYTYLREDKYDPAKDTFHQLLNESQDPLIRSKAYYQLGKIYINEKRYKAAQVTFTQAAQSPDPKIQQKATNYLYKLNKRQEPMADVGNIGQGTKRSRIYNDVATELGPKEEPSGENLE